MYVKLRDKIPIFEHSEACFCFALGFIPGPRTHDMRPPWLGFESRFSLLWDQCSTNELFHYPCRRLDIFKIFRLPWFVESENPRPESFRTFTHKAGLLRFGTPLTSNLVNGVRSYYLLGDLAKLERVLVKWCLDKLRMKGWKYVSVPDMLPESLIVSITQLGRQWESF